MRSAEEVERVLDLATQGLNHRQIARATGIPRGTVRDWLYGKIPVRGQRGSGGRFRPCMRCHTHLGPFPSLTLFAYAYLLGLYLGDGCISEAPRGVFHLRICLDRAYPVIIEECATATAIVMPASKASVYPSRTARLSVVSSWSRHWPCLFPQHGKGKKHDRPILLAEWQRESVARYPHRLLRGLIHSDGSRHLNTIRHPAKTYRYPRYEFCNYSTDIQGIFCEYCDKVGVEWRQMNRFKISVARRDSVARMDEFIGPKR